MILKKKMLSYVVKSTLCLMLVMPMAEAGDKDFDEKESKQNSGTLQLVAFSAASKERKSNKRQYDGISLEELPYLSRQVLGVLSEIENGTLVIELPTLGQQITFQGSKMPEESAVISISDLASFASRVAARGEIGLGESYMLGEWSSPDLRKAIEILNLNDESLSSGGGTKTSCCTRLFLAFSLWKTESSKKQALKNIKAHYDLGNAFYKLWLDPSMTYSCALFKGQNDISLEQAQENKYGRILGRLTAEPGSRILDIGCGWGGFAEYAATRGYYVTGVTLSEEQLAYAKQRAIDKGFSDRATFLLKDYRDVNEQYDNVISIGMFEHVGAQYWGEFFKKVHDCLKPGRKAMLHTITYASHQEKAFTKALKTPSWAKLYIFPGMEIPLPQRIQADAEKASLGVNDVFAFGKDYATTLTRWSQQFQAHWDQIQVLDSKKFDEIFRRRWVYYLDMCAGAFSAGKMDLHHFELQRSME